MKEYLPPFLTPIKHTLDNSDVKEKVGGKAGDPALREREGIPKGRHARKDSRTSDAIEAPAISRCHTSGLKPRAALSSWERELRNGPGVAGVQQLLERAAT